MKYYSTKDKNLRINLKDAVFRGIAADGGLYMPERIPQMPEKFFSDISSLSFAELSFEVAKSLFNEDVKDHELEELVHEALNFETPVVNINPAISTLELFHGPTLAFKDVGARFMARMLALLVKDYHEDIHVLVATSGDTGSAVANGFLGVPGIKVHVLYPKGKVSTIQEAQFTTLGENITSLEIDGTFDDCQRLVKQAFNDPELTNKLTLTSANSINLARLLPQSFYYFNAFRQAENKENLVFCVPSGNFGNITAGLIAARMGLPVKHFIAVTNINDIFPNYLLTGVYKPKPSISTLANAMDVGDPSNFVRMLDLYDHSVDKMRADISSYSFTDGEIRDGIKDCLAQNKYLLDPHGSTGYLAAKEYLKSHPDDQVIFLETAHPAKFLETVEETTGMQVEMPERLEKFMKREKVSKAMSKEFEEFKFYLKDIR
jgi:threonine synthase